MNKKLNRTVEYNDDGETVNLYEDGKPDVLGASRDEGHRFLHGQDSPGDAAFPSHDEMLEAIGAHIKRDVEHFMLACLDDLDYCAQAHAQIKRTPDRALMGPRWGGY